MDRIQRNLGNAFQDVSISGVVLAADDLSSTPRVLAALKVGFTIYVVRLLLNVSTDNAATQTLQDSAGTPLVAAKTKVSPGFGPISFDFGPDGFALTADKSLTLANSAAGLAYSYTVTAYMRRTPNTSWVGNTVTVPAGFGTGS